MKEDVIQIDLNEEIEEFNDNVEKRIDLNEEAEGMNEEVEKEQIDMGEELNEDNDGSNNIDNLPDPCVGMCFDSGKEFAKYCHKYASSRGYITPYHKQRILNNDAARIPITKNFNSLVVESGRHENLPFNEHIQVLNLKKFKKRYMGLCIQMQISVVGIKYMVEEGCKYWSRMKEKGIANKKMLKKQELDQNEKIIQITFSSVKARRDGASGAYDDTLLEMRNWEDDNSQDLSLNSGIN
ncbi:hypothetical protein Cgig2_015869 [Carnegiea gigantea]|uniref:Uncharacterized protein n=1 Tax=Carnegiea gigantea TaxID=171969 RepID=A0A9Q1JM33_9CARY|nr:hypothetical protein Cgig2_015869 [Carnegiea gigantea]